jgi:hypothetical protein
MKIQEISKREQSHSLEKQTIETSATLPQEHIRNILSQDSKQLN